MMKKPWYAALCKAVHCLLSLALRSALFSMKITTMAKLSVKENEKIHLYQGLNNSEK